MCTAVEEANISDLFAVMNTTELVFEIRPEGLFGSNIMTSSQLACKLFFRPYFNY